MSDVLTKAQRSYCMSQIRSKGTKPEILLRKALWRKGFRYRLKSKLPGKPDFVFPSRKLVVFVDGCFWHRCPNHYQPPKQNASFWEEKIAGNVARDAAVNAKLATAGYSVVRIWDHELRGNIDDVAERVVERLQKIAKRSSN